MRHCRNAEWHAGLHYLRHLLDASDDPAIPTVAWSYLGQALARCERRLTDARALCERSLVAGFAEPENHLNLAWVHLLGRDRASAAKAVLAGLAVDNRHPGLLELRRRLGVRQPPVLRFLSRSHPLNVWLGRARHSSRERQR